MQAKLILALLASSLTHTVLAAAAPGAGPQAVHIRQISPDIPTKSDANGNPVPFNARSLTRRQAQIDAEVPTKSDAQGNPVPFNQKTKREIEEAKAIIKRNPIAKIPSELPTRSGPDGIPVPFGRR